MDDSQESVNNFHWEGVNAGEIVRCLPLERDIIEFCQCHLSLHEELIEFLNVKKRIHPNEV